MDRLGKYEIRSILGRGAMGTVYEGWDPIISRRVAIKTVRLPDSDDSEEREQLGRFQQEAQAAGRLHHPNIVGVFDYAETNELAYIVMEFVNGRTLKALLEDAVRPGLAEVGRLMDGLLTGLDYSHANQVIHRDIKPANIIMTAAGGVKIADFGIARIDTSTMTQAGTIMGTPAYMSPEQFEGGAIDARTDIYSAGVVLFQLLTGKRPFEGNMATIMHAVMTSTAPPPSELSDTVPAALDAVAARAMARSADGRYATAAAFNVALQAAIKAPMVPQGLGDLLGSDETVVQSSQAAIRRPAPATATPAQAALPAKAAAKRSRLPLAAAGVVGLLAAGGGAFWALNRPAAPGPAAATIVPKDNAASDTIPETDKGGTTDVQPPTGDGKIETKTTIPATTSTEEPPPVVVKPPPVIVLSPEEVRRAIAAVLRTAPCSLATGDDSLPAAATIRGVAGIGQPEANLRNAVQTAGAAVTLDWQVTAADGPYCGMLDLIRPYARPFDGTSRGVVAGTSDGNTALLADDLIRPRVVMPEFPGFLQLDYIASDGSIQHIHDASPGVPSAALATALFGTPRSGFAGYAVTEPFGTDMIVAIASSVPLFRAARPATTDTLAAYQRDLRTALEQAVRGGARISATALVIQTSPRPAPP